MKKRNSVLEYRRAIERQTRGWNPGALRDVSRDVIVDRDAFASDVVPGWLTKTRRLSMPRAPLDDFSQAIRVLQRHNRLLRRRFGVGWPEAVAVVEGEARRRGVAVASVARVLAAGLRADEKGARA